LKPSTRISASRGRRCQIIAPIVAEIASTVAISTRAEIWVNRESPWRLVARKCCSRSEAVRTWSPEPVPSAARTSRIPSRVETPGERSTWSALGSLLPQARA
jgi:hypothetical protein